jgi:hypothetical protein
MASVASEIDWLTEHGVVQNTQIALELSIRPRAAGRRTGKDQQHLPHFYAYSPVLIVACILS